MGQTTTIGLSPKLYPAVISILVGLVLVLIDEKDIGLGVLLTGVGSLGLGYAAPPGSVVVESHPTGSPGSDARLGPETVVNIEAGVEPASDGPDSDS